MTTDVRWQYFYVSLSPLVAFYTPFLKEVCEKKPEIEQAFHMEEPVTLDSGEGTLEHSMHQLPQPPPRHESYMLKNTAGTDGSGSENYEHLPTRSMNSLNGPDDNLKFNLNDNSEKYPHLYMLGEKDMGIDDTYMNDDDKDDKARLLHHCKTFPNHCITFILHTKTRAYAFINHPFYVFFFF